MLQDLVIEARRAHPERLAVSGPDRDLSYAELDALAEALATQLRGAGVVPGDRVAVWAPKSAAVVAAMQAVLRCGAAYVPVDPTAPLARVDLMLRDCGCRAVATTHERFLSLRERAIEVAFVSLEDVDVVAGIARGLSGAPSVVSAPSALAYILYTSGSTGVPKGVCISHENALAFVLWARETLQLSPDDRLSSHAPFHFDLSVLDLYGAFAAGASVHVLGESVSYAPRKLVEFLDAHGITVWYSVPSALMLMVDEGALLTSPHSLRAVVFAGEVYPVRHLRTLQGGLPGVRLLNFYGPTETNVCTAYEVRESLDEGARPIPIGSAASGDTLEVRDVDGVAVVDGVPGQLWVSGPTVMLGYWGKPPQHGPYPTGDLVVREQGGELRYVGRLDHQVKVRGYRIELLEIEAVLAADARLKEVCVVVEGSGMQAKLTAYAVANDRAPSLIALKRACAERLPKYMIIDAVHYLPALPRTGNGKIDRAGVRAARELQEQAS